jgi:predicted GH43/DUF377 family glycosyl hydrolase
MKALALAVLLAPMAILNAVEKTSWQVAEQAALAPGTLGSWDDFAIRGSSILRTADGFTMFYKAVTFSGQERSGGIGTARSADGITWQKSNDNPILTSRTNENEDITSFTATQWNNQFWAAFAVRRDEDENSWVELARSDDGTVWEPAGRIDGLPLEPAGSVSAQPCLYAEARILHLWWVGRSNGQSFLCHSISRDARTWMQPTMQPTTEIDPREISAVRIYPSGNYYILVYIAHDEDRNRFSIVTKISREARSWFAKGPPEFVVEQPPRDLIPAMIFTAEGARLFFPELLPVKNRDPETNPQKHPSRGCVLRTAFCPKSAYVGY